MGENIPGSWYDKEGNRHWEQIGGPVTNVADGPQDSTVPYPCPICLGRGFVAGGFYSTTTGMWSTATIGTEKCRSCWGAGVLWR